MLRPLRVVVALVPLLAGAPVLADMYRCENAAGVIEYNNATGSASNKNCRKVEVQPMNTIPAPAPKPAAAAASRPVGSTAAASPSSFPKVDSSAQKARDNDRRRILEDELRKERDKLAELKKEFNNGEPERRGDERNYQKYLDRLQKLKEDIGRAEGNVGTLEREIGSVKE